MKPDRAQDRLDIEACLLRYTRGVDRKDWELVRSAYHTDAHDNHGNYKGGIDGFIDSLIRRHATIEQSLHLVSNLTIEFADTDVALLEAYFIVHQRLSPEAGDARLAYLRGAPIRPEEAVETEVVGRYVDHMTRREGVWRIQNRTVVFEVSRGWPAPADGGLRDTWALSRRDGKDPVELTRRGLGII